MKITILKEKLKEGVNVVEKISQKILALPILQNILIEIEDSFLKLTTTNLESAITWWGLVKVEKPGKICIPIKFFSSFLSLLPKKPINIESKELILNITCENYDTKIKGFNSEDFPIIPQIPNNEYITIDNITFCQSLNQIIGIPSPSMARPEISGIFFSFQDKFLKLVATDSLRLAERKIFFPNNFPKEYSFILPQTAGREIINIFGEKEGDLRVYFSSNQVFFEFLMPEVSHPQIRFTSRLLEGEYPNYQEIIPKKYETSLLVPKEEFLNQIKTASLFSAKSSEIKLKISSKKVEIISQNPDLGDYKSELGGKIKGKEIEVSFNHRFLIDGVSEINSNELIFELTDQEGPAILKPTNKDDYFYLIMPIKTN